MWIRTELGTIAFKIKEDEDFVYYSNGYILDKGDYKSWWVNERDDDYGYYKIYHIYKDTAKILLKSKAIT